MVANFVRTGRSIIAIGRNFAEHAKELNNAVPTEPFYFLKPTSSYVANGGKVEIPRGTVVHHEIELGVVIGKGGRDISESSAESHIGGYALAIDMTARNIQDKVKKKGLPWSTAKGFDTFTPISSLIPKHAVHDPHNINLWLKINGQFKQNGNTKDMIFGIPALIKHISSIMTLQEGDLILTGTPSGVGPVSEGDKITAGLANPDAPDSPIASLDFGVIARQAGNFGFRQASGIDTLLDRSIGGEDVALEAILDEDDLLNECKAQNTRLIEYLQRIDVLRRLLGYACGIIEAEEAAKFKYPHVATEVLCSEIWSIAETCLHQSDQLLVPFWDNVLSMSNSELNAKPLIGPNFTRIATVFMAKRPEEMFAFIRAQPNVLDRMLNHIEIPAFVDIIFRLIQLEELPGAGGVIHASTDSFPASRSPQQTIQRFLIPQWLSEEGLIPKLVELLSPTYPPDLHATVADVLKGIIALCAPSPGSQNDQMPLVANRFSRQLASEDITARLVSYMLDDVLGADESTTTAKPSPHLPLDPSVSIPQSIPQPSSSDTSTSTARDEEDTHSISSLSSASSSHSEYHSIISSPSERSTSSLIHVSSVVIELMRKNNSDFFEPYLFHTIRHRLIAIQQQYLPQLNRPEMDAEQRSEDDRLILERAMSDMTEQMGIVHFGPLLTALSARLAEFQTLLGNPRSVNGPVKTTVGEIIPLTTERFRICELYAELLHCSSLALLNRPDDFGPQYDAEGRLVGGLGGLEELARVISAGSNEQGDEDEDRMTPPRSRSLTQEPDDSPVDSRGTMSSSLASIDSSTGDQSESPEGGSPNSPNRITLDANDDNKSDDSLGHMEEISMHDDPSVELRIPHSPQPSREPLPPAPFAVPSPRPSPSATSLSLPSLDDSYLVSTSNPNDSTGTSPATETPKVEAEDIDPFADPNDSPTSPTSTSTIRGENDVANAEDSRDAQLSDSISSSVALGDSTILASELKDSTHFALDGSTPDGPVLPRPGGELFREQMLKLNVLNTMLDLFFGFPMNNFLHNVVYDLLHQLMTGRLDKAQNRDLIVSLFRDARLIHRIIEAQGLCDAATATRKGVRLAYMGHLTLISEDVIAALSLYPPDFAQVLAEFCPQPQWDRYVSGRFSETKARDSSRLGGGKPSVSSSSLGSTRVDEADRLPPLGSSSSELNPRGSVQNVVFAAVNEDEEDEASRRAMSTSPRSEEFANYLSQQINGSTNGQFISPGSSDNSDDDEDDVKWFDDVATGFVSTSSTASRDQNPSSGTTPHQPQNAIATFDDSFGDFGDFAGHSGSRSVPLRTSDDFVGFDDPQLAAEAQTNFTAEFSDDFAFPSTSAVPASVSFEDDEFANVPPSNSGFTFGNTGDDDDDFGDFQGVDLEITVSTQADGSTVGSTIPDEDPFMPAASSTTRSPLQDFPLPVNSTGSSSHSRESSHDVGSGETPRAGQSLFDDAFGSSPPRSPTRTSASSSLTATVPPPPESTVSSTPFVMNDVDQDFFAFNRLRPVPEDDLEGVNSSNVSNALSLLERSFGKVSVEDLPAATHDTVSLEGADPGLSDRSPASDESLETGRAS